MGTIFTNKQKDCCICQFWDGARKINFAKDRVTVERPGDKGICRNPKSGTHNGRQTLANYSGCIHFEKWNELK